MANQPSQPLPPHGRLISAGMAGAAAIGLLLNHYRFESLGIARLMLLCLGPLALFIGIGGMIEPKIFWSVGKYGKGLPAIYKVIGGVLGGLGVAVTLLLLLFVCRLGPPGPKRSPGRPNQTAAASPSWREKANRTVTPSQPERGAAAQEVMLLTYDRSAKRWVEMDEAARRGVRREDAVGVTTLHYAEGKHALLKVLWPDVVEVGDRFTVEVQGANSIEAIDLEGADANARTSIPASDGFVEIEIRREEDEITFVCDGERQKPYYASGKLRGAEAESALLASSLRAGFSVKKGERTSFRNARIEKR